MINELPYAATHASCEGHTYEELIHRGYSPPTIEREWPLGYSPAYVDLYLTDRGRYEFWNWLRSTIDMRKVTIHMEPVKENRFYSPATEEIAFTRDKVFNVSIVSKELRMPLR